MTEPTPLAASAAEPKPKSRSKTFWGILSTVAGVALMGLGLDGSSAELLADGIQVEDIGPILATIGAAVAAWGIRKGTQPGARPVK